MSAVPNRALIYVAWLNAGLHVAGLVCAVLGMRPGTPALPLADRMKYLAEAPLGWQLGWGMWMLCVPAVVTFFYLAANRLATPLARLALGVVLAAGTIDLCCDTVFLLVFPSAAARGTDLFLTIEQATSSVSLIIANGFYSIACLLLTLALRQKNVGKIVIVTGYGVMLFGSLLAAAGFTGVPWHVEWATGPTIGLYCVWAILTAHALQTTEADA